MTIGRLGGETVFRFCVFASIIAVSSAVAAAPSADSPSVRQAANGEFITRHYPYGALQKGEYGKVSFELTVEPDGALGGCEVTRSSGFATLDRETCEFIVKYAKLKPVLNREGRASRAVQQGFINWQLPAGARKAPTPASLRKIPLDRFGKPIDMNRTVCRTTPRTGSRVGSTKVCMTRTEWARSERENRERVQDLQNVGGGCGAASTPCWRR
jgi:TonB family protein